MTIFSMVSEKSMLGNPLLSDSDRSGFQAYFFQDHAKSPKRLASSAAAHKLSKQAKHVGPMVWGTPLSQGGLRLQGVARDLGPILFL